VYTATYDRTFAATRDAFVNRDYVITASDFDGGVLIVGTEEPSHSPTTALVWSILLPPVGDGYLGRWGWAVVDLLLWPISIVWAAPSNYMIARGRRYEIEGNVSLEEVGSERTRSRISLVGIDHDVESYPVRIRDLQEEIERQLFLKAGDTLGGEPQ
jgi:hypothetical protein